jgi:hypothetical protein
MVKKAKKVRPRTERRERERVQRTLVREREKLAAISVGGSPDRPISIPTSAVIQIRAESRPCPQCEGPLRLQEESVLRHNDTLLRCATVACGLCGTKRTLYVVIDGPNRPN